MATQTILLQATKPRVLVASREKPPCRAPISRKEDLYSSGLLINVLECFMMNRIRENEALERRESSQIVFDQSPPEPSLFHALEPPSITPIEYLRRLHRYSFCSKSVFVAAFLYLEKIASMERTTLRVNSLSVHRLVLTAVLLATKVMDDVLYDNAHFAKVGGLDVKELNTLELDMLKTLRFGLHIEPEEFEAFQSKLLDEVMSTRDPDFIMLPGRLRNLGYDYTEMSKLAESKAAPSSPTSSMDVSFGV